MTWAGVDVGGRRKGFHAVVVDGERLVAGPARLGNARTAVAWLAAHDPRLVAVDSPCAPAPRGLRSRPCERALARAVCGIRYTPDRDRLAGNPYYEWILNGFELYAALAGAGIQAVECFPTASFTRWAGARGERTRAEWTRAALGLRVAHGQDGRDAVAAALTARSAALGAVEEFGDIVVPLA